MDRPLSQLENARPSHIKAPSASRLPTSANSRPLQDLTHSDLNSKTLRDGSMAPPSQSIANGKHKMAGSMSESAPKRKTLMERGGEPLQQYHRSQMQQPRPYGMTAAAASRAINGSKLANGYNRPHTSQQHQQYQRVGSGNTTEDDGLEYAGRRKGVPTLPLDPCAITLRKTRKRNPLTKSHPLHVRTRSQHRGSSISHMSELEIGAEKENISNERAGTAREEDAVVKQPVCLPIDTAGEDEIDDNADETRRQASPSKLPKLAPSHSPTPSTSAQTLVCPTSKMSIATRAPSKPAETMFYATKSSLTPFTAWDTTGRLQDMDQMLLDVHKQMAESVESKTALEATVHIYKTRVDELTETNRQLTQDCRAAISDLERARNDLHTVTIDFEQARRDHVRGQADLDKQHQQRAHDMEMQHMKLIRNVERESEQAVEQLEKEVVETKRSFEKQSQEKIADLTSEHWEEIDHLKTTHEKLMLELQREIDLLKRSDEGRAAESALTVQGLRNDITAFQAQVEVLNSTILTVRAQVSAAESRQAGLEQEKANLISKTHFLEGNQEAQSEEFTNMTHRLQVAEAKAAAAVEQLRREETVRRRLNAQILELKGNIRVFARVRPVLPQEEDPAKVEYPDAHDLNGGKEMLVHAPTTFSATGKERNEKHNFGFDKVFGPDASNAEVFDDCRELVQSVIDGYNVSILSYGQTGSGKTFGMSGVNGIIPCSIELLLSEIHRLQQKGWEYAVEASFVEVYNEALNDLLGDAKTWDHDEETGASTRTRTKTRHEIHHDSVTGKTSVSNLTSVALWPPPENDASWPPAADVESDSSQGYTRKAVAQLLDTATKNRRVAATKANERSSRSHSVFLLSLKGSCNATGESSEGILNLVDLAGSERLKHSGAEGGRAKETAAINTSLKSLGDVIEKVGTGGHVPYRNSKLTYLLQSSLGGTTNGKSSRTLMLLHLSPLQAHWQETKTSLQFGTKVHGTHIGTAKKR